MGSGIHGEPNQYLRGNVGSFIPNGNESFAEVEFWKEDQDLIKNNLADRVYNLHDPENSARGSSAPTMSSAFSLGVTAWTTGVSVPTYERR